ncbi:Transcription factor LHW [Dendrobium catenatum]|uniref:Transcription factor LHW n=1 Tax=Dendrobium catenatum TaxID=906689 RepID=A0A2I0X856_9ASPA|nr:Transcription factor LHW [Dendrobium catenatum]
MDGEGIDELCRRGGWTYGVLWRIDRRDPRLLVLEESYYEEKSGRIFEKMINHVHVIGQGTIGEVAISGKHRWINFDAQCMESIEVSTSVKSDIYKENAEWRHQISSGIKTVAVISLPPLGVILFGSTQKIYESSNFVGQAQHLLRQLGIREVGYDHVDWNFTYPQATFASVISSLSSSNFKDNVWRDDAWKQRQENHLSLEYSSLASGFLSMGSQIGTRSQTCSLKPHASSMPIASSSSSSFNCFHNLFHETPSVNSTTHKFTSQQEALTEAQILLPPNNGGNCKSPSNLLPTYFKSNTRAKETSSFSCMEHKPFPGITMPGVFNMIPTTFDSSTTRSDAFDVYQNSTLMHGIVGPQAMLDRGGISSNTSVPSLDGAGNLQELQHCSSPPVSLCGLSTVKSSSNASPFTPELPENFLISHDLNPENSALAHSTNELETQHIHDKPLNNHIDSSHQTDNQVNNGSAAEYPNSISVCVSSSLDRSSNWNESTSNASTKLVSDNDLFDGMELDLSPMILRQECWDDIVLPIVSNNCISEMEMGSVTGAGKDLFSDSSLEQLLDAVVSGNSNLSSSCNSVRKKTNVASNRDSKHQLPTKVSDAQANHHPVADPSLIQTPPVSLPEWNSEKLMLGSPKSVEPKPNLCAWIFDNCNVNAEGSAFNQTKKTEESAKVIRKRARPGESTRPRPKDRQQIQDRVKELREIVPNGAKCSIDALLDRTIRHLLFLQSVTKYANKLKHVDEPKIIGEESGVVLKDNTNGGLGGATWAYEVAGQTMVCPILIEDLHPSGQMLVEMLCEERGFFLEIADVVRGFGLTILKGVMENRGRKVWARFIVEANRDVTRMDIFLSLVQLLQQTSSCIRSCEPRARIMDTSLTSYQQSSAAIPIGLVDRLQ